MSPLIIIAMALIAAALLGAQVAQDRRRPARATRVELPPPPPPPPPPAPAPPTAAPATAQAPPSLASRVLLAVALMIGFYVFSLAIAAGLLYLPVAEWRFAGRLDVRLLVFGLGGAVAILSGILPRVDHFRDPGPRLAADTQPRLFEAIGDLAGATGQAPPRDVFLVPDVNAWVSERGGIMGIGSHRVMGIGLPLLEVLSVTELRAVLAHEFGHFHGGDTALGPWVYKTRAAIERTVKNLAQGRSWLRAPFIWYGNTFLRVTHAVSRRQELAADQLAARVVGADALANGLKKIHAVAPLFQNFWVHEVAPVLQAGFRPPIGGGFAQFLSAARARGQTEATLAQALAVTTADPYDTHPPLPERLAALSAPLPSDDVSGEAAALLEDPASLEPALLAALDPEAASRLRETTWDEVNTVFWIPFWEGLVRANHERLAHLTPVALAPLAGRPPRAAVLLKMAPDEAHATNQAIQQAMAVLGAALSVLLHQHGWRIRGLPGQDVTFYQGSIETQPFALLMRLLGGAVPEDTWRRLWSTSGLGAEDLGALAASLPASPAASPALAPAAPPQQPRLEPSERQNLERRYAELSDEQIAAMYQTGPAGMATPDAWELLEKEARRRRLV